MGRISTKCGGSRAIMLFYKQPHPLLLDVHVPPSDPCPLFQRYEEMSDDNGIFALIISEMVPLVDLLQDFKILSDTTTAKARENI